MACNEAAVLRVLEMRWPSLQLARRGLPQGETASIFVNYTNPYTQNYGSTNRSRDCFAPHSLLLADFVSDPRCSANVCGPYLKLYPYDAGIKRNVIAVVFEAI